MDEKNLSMSETDKALMRCLVGIALANRRQEKVTGDWQTRNYYAGRKDAFLVCAHAVWLFNRR